MAKFLDQCCEKSHNASVPMYQDRTLINVYQLPMTFYMSAPITPSSSNQSYSETWPIWPLTSITSVPVFRAIGNSYGFLGRCKCPVYIFWMSPILFYLVFASFKMVYAISTRQKESLRGNYSAAMMAPSQAISIKDTRLNTVGID